MRKDYHLLWKIPLGALEVFWGILTLYVVLSLIGMSIQIGEDYTPKPGGITIYIKTDGIHTDFVVPVKTDITDWTKKIRWSDLSGTDTSFNYLAFGWGDQGFFLNTPEWSDLKFSTAFDALFYRGKSAVHAVYQYEPQEGLGCERLIISRDQYRHLISYIEETLLLDEAHPVPICIQGKGYWGNDAFYLSKGKYSLFSTCNSWINGGLKQAGLPACLWTPLSFGILQKYDH